MADMNGVQRREIKRTDDPFGIPACFYWTVDEVADWIESIGYGKYKENFRSHFINGRKLLTVDACVLPRMGITHFGDILTLSRMIRDQLHVSPRKRGLGSVYSTVRRGTLGIPHPTGNPHSAFTWARHRQDMEKILDARLNFFKKRNLCYAGWCMQPGYDEMVHEQEKTLAKERNCEYVQIGRNQQERLLAVSTRETFPREPKQWSGLPLCINGQGILDAIPRRLSGHSRHKQQIKPPAKKQESIQFQPPAKKQESPPKTGPWLPITFCWKSMQPTAGYPQLPVDKRGVCDLDDVVDRKKQHRRTLERIQQEKVEKSKRISLSIASKKEVRKNPKKSKF